MALISNTLKLLADKISVVGLPVLLYGEGKDPKEDRIVFNYIPTSLADDKLSNNLINCNLYIKKLSNGQHDAGTIYDYYDQLRPLILGCGDGEDRTNYYAFQILSEPQIFSADNKDYSYLNIRITATSS